jgi:beta-lactamase superfamily II metal-dependent hydrolase
MAWSNSAHCTGGTERMANPFPSNILNVRMYKVGFGDCFLLSFPSADGHRHVLVDCGAHPKGTLGNLAEVAENVRDTTGNHLAAIVATHRHQDHIWGFERGLKTFESMTVDEVWLPWVEELDNLEARAMWKKHDGARAMLEARLNAAPAGPIRDTVAAVIANLKPNQVALDGLRSRFGKGIEGVRYLYGGHPDLVAPGGIDGLVVKVLGPPKTEAFLKKMRPPKAERWTPATSMDGPGANGLMDSPFDERWLDPDDGKYWAMEPSRVFDQAERALFKKRMADSMDLAFALEDAVNNSSLVLMFLIGKFGLLMTGDAQWGSWDSWMRGDLGEQTFERVTLFKLGHHGSHNATPRSIIDRLPQNLTVLVPTQNTPFPTIPEPDLIAALAERSKGRVVRSDTPGELPQGCTPGDFWIDFQMETD